MELMSTKVVESFPFCTDDARFAGTAEITRGDYPDRSVVGVQLRVGSTTINLSRGRLKEVIEVLKQADEAASKHYLCLLKEMNENGVQEEDAQGLQE